MFDDIICAKLTTMLLLIRYQYSQSNHFHKYSLKYSALYRDIYTCSCEAYDKRRIIVCWLHNKYKLIAIKIFRIPRIVTSSECILEQNNGMTQEIQVILSYEVPHPGRAFGLQILMNENGDLLLPNSNPTFSGGRKLKQTFKHCSHFTVTI
jgi:hypothetical protein